MVRRMRVLATPAVLIPLTLFALALLLRLIGVDWHGRHADEDIGGPVRLLAGDFHLHSFYYPPLLTYLVAIADVALFAWGRLLGWWHSAAELRDAYFSHSTPFFVTARVVVAICSATAAPIAWALAREVRLSRNAALMSGVAGMVVPGAVYWAHIAKSDNALGPAYLLCMVCALRMIDRPASLARIVLLGASIAVAMSFKQSALFFIAPTFAILMAWSFSQTAGVRTLTRSWAIALAVTVVVGAILNIAILSDPKPFLAAQEVQSQMSFRAASLRETLATSALQLTAASGGASPLALFVAAILWLAGILRGTGKVRLLLIVLGIGWTAAAITICAIAGSRQPLQLWLPYLVVGFVAAAIAAGALVDAKGRAFQLLGYGGFGFLVISSAMRIVPILNEATEASMSARVAAIVREAAPVPTRIVSSVDLSADLPLSPQSQTLPRARHERLAKLYGITLPPPERPVTGVANGYTVVDFPWVIGGLEAYRADQVKVVIPYAWPLQPEEWQLRSWLAQGFHLFVVSDAVGLRDNPVPAYRGLFREIERCPQIAVVPTNRLMFGESETRIYRCD